MKLAMHPRRALVRLFASLAVALVAVTPAPARAVEPMGELSIVLLEPESIIEQRVYGDPTLMAGYIQKLYAASVEALRQNPQQLPAGGFIVVATRPGGKAHAWFDFKPALDDKTTAALTRVVESTPTMPVTGGDVVFAMKVSAWGGKLPTAAAPAPKAWADAAAQAGHELDTDTIVDQLWPR